MAVNDTISDMLTRIRNAVANREKSVNVLRSNVCVGIARILKEEGYIEGFDEVADGRQGLIRVRLRYGPGGEQVITELKRQSKPGRRIYIGVEDLSRNRILQGLGIAIVSTSRGVMSDRKCKTEKVGGELLATVY
jgi:small subunit ribosomal protein S8